MNIKAIAALTIVATTSIASSSSLGSEAYAQSNQTPRSDSGNYTLNGSSLDGIDNRTARDDYARFFSGQNSNNSRNRTEEVTAPTGVWQVSDQIELRRNEPTTTPNNVIFPQGNETFSGNDGVQVQIDIVDAVDETNR